eukprot:15297431-Ditylum_brightwellii.AAC.1
MLEIWRGLTREIEKDFLMVQLKVPETALQSGSLLVCSMESSTEGMMVGEMVEEMEGPSVIGKFEGAPVGELETDGEAVGNSEGETDGDVEGDLEGDIDGILV